MRKLVFKIGEESIPKVMGADEFESTPFSYVLKSGKEKFITLWRNTTEERDAAERNNKQGRKDTVAGDDYNDIQSEQCPNNIIAFLGERGSGKTSCLLSLQGILENDKDKEVRRMAKQSEFLPIVDPLFFDKNHNILDIFIGELYRNTKVLLDRWGEKGKNDREDLRMLQSLFKEVKEALIFLDMSRSEELEDSQESLLTLSDGVNLRRTMTRLVDAYLKCVRKKVLVISIDDIDLNINEAYEMLEQIRKYLIIPKVVILLSAKFEQLRSSIELYLASIYGSIRKDAISFGEITDMANHYLDKILPLNHRLEMPPMNDLSLYELDIIERDGVDVKKDNHYDTVEYAVLSLIYMKCRYLFYNYEFNSSLIIPDNLRELKQLVTLLFEMPAPSPSTDAHAQNKSKFKEYFITQWLQRLHPEDQDIAKKLWEERDLKRVNKLAITLLCARYNELDTLKYYAEDSEFDKGIITIPDSLVRIREIIKPDNLEENVSVGDVERVIDFLRSSLDSTESKALLFFIITLYSIRLYEAYDEMSDCRKNNEPLSSLGSKDRKLPKLMNNRDYKIPEYYKFVGRGFFTLTGESFLPFSPGGRSRELCQIEGRLLYDHIQKLIAEYKKDSKCVDKPDFVLKINLAEFFILCVSRSCNNELNKYSPFTMDEWRGSDYKFYFSPFSTNDGYLLFDLTAPFINCIYPQFSYERFSGDFYEMAKVCKKSLLNRLLNENRRYKQGNIDADLMSRVAIRNMEVLNDLGNWLVSKKNEVSPGDLDSDIKMLALFFKRLDKDNGGYSVKTYLKDENKEDSFHTISFSPIAVLGDFLKDLIDNSIPNQKSVKRELTELFLKIYQRKNKIKLHTKYMLWELKSILRDSGESNIPGKDSLLSSIVGGTESIDSDMLIDYLTKSEVYREFLFTDIFDKDLFEEYKKRIVRDIDEAINFATTKWHEKKEVVEKYQNEIDHLRKKHNEHLQQLETAKKVLDKLEKDYVKKEHEVKDKHFTISRVNKEIGDIAARLEKIAKERDRCLEDQASLQAQADEIKPKLFDEVNDALILRTLANDPIKKKLKEEWNGIRSIMKEIKERLSQLENESSSLQSAKATSEEALQRVEKELQDLETLLPKFTERLENEKARYAEYERYASSIQDRINILSFSLADMKRDERASRKDLQKLLDEKKSIIEQLDLHKD